MTYRHKEWGNQSFTKHTFIEHSLITVKNVRNTYRQKERQIRHTEIKSEGTKVLQNTLL